MKEYVVIPPQSGNLQRIVDKINTLRVFVATQAKEDDEKEKDVIKTGFMALYELRLVQGTE